MGTPHKKSRGLTSRLRRDEKGPFLDGNSQVSFRNSEISGVSIPLFRTFMEGVR
jgi:hypothetical protein